MDSPAAPLPVAAADSVTGKVTFRSLLRERNFALLWYGQIISSLGDRFYQFALLYVILGIKQGLDAGKDSARVTFCAMLPGLLLAPFYGWAIDRFSRRSVMIYADLGRALLTLSFLYFWFVAHSWVAVYLAVFCMGAMNGLFIPARQAALPQIVTPARLVAANAMISLIGVIANFIGLPIAGLVVSLFGAPSSFLLNAVGFLISAWCIYQIRAPLSPTRQAQEAGQAAEVGSWRGALAGCRLLLQKRELGALVLINSVFAFVSALVIITILQQVVVSVDLSAVQAFVDWLKDLFLRGAPRPPDFEIRTLAFGLLMAAIGIGLGVGVFICAAAGQLSRAVALPYVGLVLLGLALIGFSQLHDYLLAVAGAGLMGILSAFIVIPIESRLQNDVADAVRGRLFAVRNLCTSTAFLIGLGLNLSGRLLEAIGPAVLIAYIGIGTILAGLVLAALNAGSLRSFWQAQLISPARD